MPIASRKPASKSASNKSIKSSNKPTATVNKKRKTNPSTSQSTKKQKQQQSDDDFSDIDAVADDLINDDDEDDFTALTNIAPVKPAAKSAKQSAAKPSAKQTKQPPAKQTLAKKASLMDDSDDDQSMDVSMNGDDSDDLMDEFDDAELDDEDDEPAAKPAKPTKDSALFARKKRSGELFDGDDALDADSDAEDWEQAELPIERKARLLAVEQTKVAEEADAELQTNFTDRSIFHLPTEEELAAEQAAGLDPTSLMARVHEVIGVLGNFTANREAGRSRREYMIQLREDLASYFSYLPELIEYFLEHFSVSECLEFLESNEVARPVTIRTNTLRTKRRDLAQTLLHRGVNLDPIGEWTKVGLKIYDSQVPIGATPEYLAGHYMLQSAASFMPVMALAPQPGDTVLDMAASPGGKSTYCAALMKNEGLLICNDLNSARLKSLTGNLHRMGVKNALVTNFDGRKIGPHLNTKIDRVLLDAPCSGLGVISHDPSIKLTKTMKDIARCSHLQKELILSAIDLLEVASGNSKGGYIVYSTCSIAVEENEEVIEYALAHRHVKLVDSTLTFGKDGLTSFRGKNFHPSMNLTKRYYPHVHNMDGFFVAKLKKYASGVKTVSAQTNGEEENEDENQDDDEEEETSQPKKLTTIVATPAVAPAAKSAPAPAKQAEKKQTAAPAVKSTGKAASVKKSASKKQ